MIKTEGLTHIHLIGPNSRTFSAVLSGSLRMKELFRDGPAMLFLNTPGSRDSITLNEDPSMTVGFPRRARAWGWLRLCGGPR